MHDLTAFQRDILYVLAGSEDAYGLAIKQELEEYYEGEVNHGRLYPNLDDLVERGYVEKGQLDRRTNSYNLAEEGTSVLAERREWEAQYLGDEGLQAVEATRR
jgi:DNA-binding PadR family transcriptional regulator